MGVRRHGQGRGGKCLTKTLYNISRGQLPPMENVVKCFMLQLLPEVSVDEVFMHYFKKM